MVNREGTQPMTQFTCRNEKDVKKYVKKLLDKHGYFWWMPPANGFGKVGISDFNAIKTGMFMAIETKFGGNQPTPHQKAYLATVASHDHFAFVVDENNLDRLALFLQQLDESVERTANEGKPPTEEQGAGMLDCIRGLIQGY